MSTPSPLAGGVFAAGSGTDDLSELRQLVGDLAKRSYTRRLGSRRLPDEFDTPLWADLETAGLTRLTSTPDLGANPGESAVVLSGVSRYSGAVPLAETDLLAGWLASLVSVSIPDTGALTVALAAGKHTGGQITGTAYQVPWARDCAALILALRTPDGELVRCAQPAEVAITTDQNMAGEPRDRVEFILPEDNWLELEPGTLDELSRRGAWARCCQIIGALDAVALSTLAHTTERAQFGRPLSKNQSVQHALATLAGQIERARAVTALAVTAAADYGFGSPQTDYALTLAKVTLGRVVGPVTAIGHQLHGAIGVTAEHHLWLSTSRAQSWITEFGTTSEYAQRLGRAALETSDPWKLLSSNDFASWEQLSNPEHHNTEEMAR